MPAVSALALPVIGNLARVRTRTYLVESVEHSPHGTEVGMSCLDDDAQGSPLRVIWELELDALVLDTESWSKIGDKGFDPARLFAAYLHTLRWNCITATDPRLFQAPFRAGIQIDAYQLEPLRKALTLPRVNLFIADDVGLGKTIEAGLIASELLLRRRIHDIVVACPPSMLIQWKEELESRFGLVFEILDREYVQRVRRERGFGVNPWKTHPRFLVSHKLLIDETYAGPMRDWLGNLRPGSLLILDEAHHAAPSSGSRYAIDSKFTRAIRDIANRFEHRLFLSATPHNGHSNSFSALLEILDPQRFTRGVKASKSNLETVMVRRIKDDIRAIEGGFAERKVPQIDIDGLPADAPELRLAELLDDYRTVRLDRVRDAASKVRNEAALVVTHLQQRLLSSIPAFARTLDVHRKAMERAWIGDRISRPVRTGSLDLIVAAPDADDERATLPEDELASLEDEQVVAASALGVAEITPADIIARERKLLDEMRNIANAHSGRPDARIRHLLTWMKANMSAAVRTDGKPGPDNAPWSDTRILIFTEYEDTRRYIENQLCAAIEHTPDFEERIAVYHGPTPVEKREEIKRAFNMPPAEHPVRILIATDAAREGLNLQAHCHNLFHFDVPWNPARLEQRNGRIDRKLQPAAQVFCHYFVYRQRPQDRILRTLVRKTEVIRTELGSLAQVLEGRLAKALAAGIWKDNLAALESEIDGAALDDAGRKVADEELESTRDRREALAEQIKRLNGVLADSRKRLGLENTTLRDTLSCSLVMMEAEPLRPLPPAAPGAPARFVFPNLALRQGGDPSWQGPLDTLRAAPREGPRNNQWRKENPPRPVIFDAPAGIDDTVVQLHLSHRLVRRLLGRFLSQGFVHDDLTRACLTQSEDGIPRVVLLGRLALYGRGATRLHEEIVCVTARWIPLDKRTGALEPYGRDAEKRTMELLESAIRPDAPTPPSLSDAESAPLRASLAEDIKQLLPHLNKRGDLARAEAEKALRERATKESEAMRTILVEQRGRVTAELANGDANQLLLSVDDEKRQFAANRRHWQKWLEEVDKDLVEEPKRILAHYDIVTTRFEPVGLAYLRPATSR